MLLDAGADETTASRLVYHMLERFGLKTPLDFTVGTLADKTIREKPATEDQLHRLEAIRRLLLRVDAVRAASWLWSRKAPVIAHHVVGGAEGKVAMKASTPLGVLIVRRGTGVRSALLASTLRYVQCTTQRFTFFASCVSFSAS